MLRNGLTFLLFFILLFSGYAQPKHGILMMSGQLVEGTVTGEDSLYLYYDQHKKSGKTKARKLDLERVFSIYNSNGEERVVYYMDTMVGNYMTIDEMRYYIKGEQDAMEHYHGNWAWYIGVPVTAAAGFVLSGSVLSFAVPFVYLVVAGLPPSKIRKDKIDSPQLASEEAYVLGYERVARNKRAFKSLMAGLVGTAGGFAAGQVILNE